MFAPERKLFVMERNAATARGAATVLATLFTVAASNQDT